MRKFISIILLPVLILCFTGCANTYARVNDSIWDADAILVDINDDMIIDRSHPYDISYNDNGVDVTFHFVKEWTGK